MRRLTTVGINRVLRARGLFVELRKDFGRGWSLYVRLEPGDQPLRYPRTYYRLNRRSVDEWVEAARNAQDWAQKAAARRVKHDPMGGPVAQWVNENMPAAIAHAEAQPNADVAEFTVVNLTSGERRPLYVVLGPDLKQRAEVARSQLFGPDWRLSRGEPKLPNGAGFKLPAQEREKEPELSLEDAVALAHLVAEDLAEGKLDGEKVKVVQELVGGRVRQERGSYKYVLIVGRWAIKVDKGRKPGDAYYVGAAAEAKLIEHLKQQHAELAKHFPQSVVVNFFTSVQERADPDAGRYNSQRKVINEVAKQADIGDFHQENVGFRKDDPTTPVFIDVARSGDLYGERRYEHFNAIFMAEYAVYAAKKEVETYEQEIGRARKDLAERVEQLKQLNAGA